MNRVLLVGRLVRDPETRETGSGIKYSRFTLAVSRPFGDNEADFIPIVTWRNQANFVEKYMKKGSLMSIEGRFTSSTYQNNEGNNITRYEVTAERVQALESKGVNQSRTTTTNATDTRVVEFEKDSISATEEKDLPWEIEL